MARLTNVCVSKARQTVEDAMEHGCKPNVRRKNDKGNDRNQLSSRTERQKKKTQPKRWVKDVQLNGRKKLFERRLRKRQT